MISTDTLLFIFILIASVGILVLPKSGQYWTTFILVLGILVLSSYWAISALVYQETVVRSFSLAFWQEPLAITIDNLSSFFILILNFTMLTGIIYAKGYMQQYLTSKSRMSTALHYFSFFWLHASMLQVTMMREGLSFLLVWELMALSSFLLVIFEGEKKEVMSAGFNYLIQMHIGFLFLLLGFLTVIQATGSMSFDALSTYFVEHNNFWLFLVFFIGFGVKAGFIPFHSWLPRAHPATPSHVSAVMSGVIIKMGIYGILRVLTHVQSEFLEISIFVIFISLVSGLLGVILAIYQHDLKKLLAYHSIENIGIIGVGIGVGLYGVAVDNSELVLLGFTGGILHVLNHSLFKSSLFYSAGSVYQATKTRNINNLGGIIKSMPKTSLLFFFSAVAICGLPPLNGFVSEFIIYNGVFGNLSHAGFGNSLVSVTVVVGLALIGGLAVFCFTKVFGIAFLGSPRSKYPGEMTESSNYMWLPNAAILIVMLSIGLMPNVYASFVCNTIQTFEFVDLESSDVLQLSITLANIGKANLIFVSVAIGLTLLKKWQQSNTIQASGPTWGCGYTAGSSKHQYTSTSFADNLREIISPLISFKKAYKGFDRKEVFPEERTFKTHAEDKIERKMLLVPINKFMELLPKAGLAQTGRVNDYLQYPIWFMVIIGLLTMLNII